MPQQRRPDLPVRAQPDGLAPRATPAGLAPRVTEDDIWRRITTPGADVLYGASFDEAVLRAPLLIEAVALQHVYGALSSTGVPMDLATGLAAWKARNDLERRVHGGLTAMRIAESLELNWGLWGRTWVDMFRSNPVAAARFHAVIPQLQAGFMAAMDVGRRAADVCAEPEDRQAWLRVTACFEAQAELLAHLMFAPVRRGAEAPAEPWPEAPAAPQRAPRAHRIEGRGRALPGPVAVPQVPLPEAPRVALERDVAAWPDGWSVDVRPADVPGRFIVQVSSPIDRSEAVVEPSTRSVYSVSGGSVEAMGRLRFVCLQYLGFTRVSRAANSTWAQASSSAVGFKASVPASGWWDWASMASGR